MKVLRRLTAPSSDWQRSTVLSRRDLRGLVDILADNPFAGDAIPGFAHEVWKIRLASSDMQSGKRSGYRVIYAINQATEFCYLLFIYAKPERGDVTAGDIEALLAELDET